MPGRVSLFPQALADLDRAFDWYEREAGLEVAQRFYRTVFNTFEALAESPRAGSPRWQWTNDRLEGIRTRPVRRFSRWMIFYRPANEGIQVVRILHGSRDIESLLNTDSR